MHWSLRFISDSFQGTTHFENQDGLLVIQQTDYILFIVFDGVSRSLNPKKGVEIAIQCIRDNHKNFFNKLSYDLKGLMYQTQESIMQSGYVNALTTYCAVGIVKRDRKNLLVSNLGDSRLYLVDDENYNVATIDDTLFPGSNVLTKCLGISELDKGDFREGTIQLQSQNILLCTDGFYHLLMENGIKIINILNNENINNIKDLLKQKIEGKNYDDATYIYAVLN